MGLGIDVELTRFEGLQRYATVIDALGMPSMGRAVFRSISEVADIDELFAFRRPIANGAPRSIISGGDQQRAVQRAAAYQARFYNLDPLNRAFASPGWRRSLAVRISAGEIPDAEYRRTCYSEPKFVEKLSIAERAGSGWTVLSLFRRERAGRFSDAELREVLRLSQLLLPLIGKHDVLSNADLNVTKSSAGSVEGRLSRLCPGLTARERAVCARTVAGMTAEAIGLELGIQATSVVTYRRRAYARLNISSGYQLFALVLQ